jgi:RNA polymerase sigma-70 factor (ECF subfamily)
VSSTEPNDGAHESTDVSRLVEHLFRHEAGKMVAILTRIFGLEHLSLAEDVVQEALGRALQTWPFYGVPDNPSAWLMRAARNLALDVVRREKVFRDKQADIIHVMDRPSIAPDATIFTEHEIADDRLRMMFVCCHPVIPSDAQIALALNTLCGFSISEISRAFLTSESAIAKRLTRAKQKIRQARVPFEIPTGQDLARRLDVVLEALYLLFNEGYKASSGERLVREDICREAIRLAGLLAEHSIGNCPKTHALLALMLLNAGRIPSRVDGKGNLLRLQEQDRNLWDQLMMARGMFHLAQSAAGEQITRYHLEAGISACHCAAPDFDSTDWTQILALYDRLVAFDASPIIALNRAVAVANVHGPAAGIRAVESIRNRAQLDSYHLLYAVLGDLEARLANFAAAAGYFRQALELTQLKSEQIFLSRRIQACEGQKNEIAAVSDISSASYTVVS